MKTSHFIIMSVLAVLCVLGGLVLIVLNMMADGSPVLTIAMALIVIAQILNIVMLRKKRK